ncbi:hypothetical protein [Lactococcus lactis]|uniref:YolD-like protein n=1 Tax=Lactococcus lactis subsp. lactis A12 TaxID=1137134 RepID=S6F4M8_LACLL|nr:hypothetical protein [Lactococcus lactis]CDG03764.1 Putative uncharacterized protein [Lactococcus lactis subsp. lactis A12]SBW29583.1 Putative uncharacterized protein [Lactococcus lactis subsp. lactis]
MSIIEGTKRVDRSYSPFEAIRTYQDRRAMKWNPFATAELAAAHREYYKSAQIEPLEAILESEEIGFRLLFALSSGEGIRLFLKEEQQSQQIMGHVVGLGVDQRVIIKNSDGHYQEFSEEDILNILPEKS